MGTNRGIAALLVGALVAACASESAAGPGAGPACGAAVATLETLSVGMYAALDPGSDSGCVSFPLNTSTSDVEYLVIAQSAGGIPGDSAPFELRSARLVPTAVSPLMARRRALRGPRGSIAAAFDHLLRGLERGRHRPPAALGPLPTSPGVATVAPPALGSLRTFAVCADLNCVTFDTVTARAQSVGAHVVIYVDTLAPANGLDAADIDTLQQVFDTHVYSVDTAAFGSVSDVDSNGVVLTLMTPVVNRSVTAAECSAGGFVTGFFYPGDLDSIPGSPSNHGEIFYTVVADPNGALSCAHTQADVKSFLPSTFLHELQHVISFNQHVLIRNGNPEDIWLDEALSSLAEELGGQSFLPDSSTFYTYVSGDLENAYEYLQDPGDHFLLQASDTVVADFGAGWLYARYLVDQFGDSLTHKLEQTTLTGTDNVAAQTGLPFTTTVTRWALANWVSDLPGFAPPPGLFYRSWSFRQVYASVYQVPFPLVPSSGSGSQVNIAGSLRAGSGYYVDVVQPPRGGSFTLFLGTSTGLVSPSVVPRLVVIRLR